MPESQPAAAIQAIEDPLLRAYARAWERVVELQEAIAGDPRKWRQARRLESSRRAIEREMDALDAQARSWFEEEFPQIHAMGVNAGAAELGVPAGAVWDQIQTEAVQRLASDGFGDLLKATRTVRRTTKEMIRSVIRDETLQKMIQGDTAVAAARRARQVLEQNGIHAVRYRDGSSHGLKEYSSMAVRTKTATAYNVGVLDAQGSQGVEFWQVFDGICGWAFHDDTAANGMIVTRDEALAHPISHPNCRRAFGGRPDLTSTKTRTSDQIAGLSEEEKRLRRNEASRLSKARARERAAQADGQAPKPEPRPVHPPEDELAKVQREMRDRVKPAYQERVPDGEDELAKLQREMRAQMGKQRPDLTRSPSPAPAASQTGDKGWPPAPKVSKARGGSGEAPPRPGRAPDAASETSFERGLQRTDPGINTNLELRGANPDYHVSQEFRVNCTNAVTSYELRRRGYDVTAAPLEMGRTGRSVREFIGDWGDDPQRISDAYARTADEMKGTMLREWPDGARGYVMVQFEGGLRRGGHIFSVEKQGGKLFFVDPQTGQALSAGGSAYFNDCRNEIMFGRLDNLQATDRLRGYLR